MRFREFKTLLPEATIQLSTFGNRNLHYWTNLLDLILKQSPIKINDNGDESVIVANPAETVHMLRGIWDGSSFATKDELAALKTAKVPTTDGQLISLSKIFKSPEIKGKDADYNVGDIGEIALGIATAARFVALGKLVGYQEFVAVAQELKTGTVKGKGSTSGTFSADINHANGSVDKIELRIKLASRSMLSFTNFMADPGTTPKDVQGAILSALRYVNHAEKIAKGIEVTAADDKTNTIEVVSDGVSDQKGTKADLIMTIDGVRINLISAKAGASQLGQASGHDWNKPLGFFKTVFGVDISPFKKDWGTTNESHIETLREVYQSLIIPKVIRLTGGDSVKKEKALVKQIANGLIRYSNDVNDNGEVNVIDIVKLAISPGSPGYKLMRVDSRLEAALETVDLVGKATANGLGVQVNGTVDGKSLLLFKARSYHSPAGNIVRTIIEGGPLLDKLAESDTPQPASAIPQELPQGQMSQQHVDDSEQPVLDTDLEAPVQQISSPEELVPEPVPTEAPPEEPQKVQP